MKTTVKTYKGDRALQRGLRKMAEKGWAVQDRTSRKMLWRWYSGIFTRSQKHTITFVAGAQS